MIALDTVTTHPNTAYPLCAQAASEQHHSVVEWEGKGEGRRRNDNVGEVKQEGKLEEHRTPGATSLRTLAQTQNLHCS